LDLGFGFRFGFSVRSCDKDHELIQVYCYNLSVDVALNVRFTTTGMCMKNNTHILVYVARTSNSRVISSGDLYYCLLLPQCETLCTCCSGFPMVLCPGCEDHARCSLHKKNVLSVWFVVKRRCCCNLLVDIVLNVRFTMNGMCTKNKTHIYIICAVNKQ